MPQSMLAFLAMTMAVMLSMTQQRSELDSFESVLESEYEIMANAVALEQLEIINATTSWDSLEVWDDRVVTRSFGFVGFQEPFELGIAVQYVNGYGSPSPIPTTIKEVVVSATHERYKLPMVTHARLISE